MIPLSSHQMRDKRLTEHIRRGVSLLSAALMLVPSRFPALNDDSMLLPADVLYQRRIPEIAASAADMSSERTDR
jgi:hypothetical protein